MGASVGDIIRAEQEQKLPRPGMQQTSGGGFLGSGYSPVPVSYQTIPAPKEDLVERSGNPALDVFGNALFKALGLDTTAPSGPSFRVNPYYQNLPSMGPATNPNYVGVGGRDLVASAYDKIVGRQPDAGGYEFWTNEMQQKGLTGQGLVSGFTQSPEFQRQQEFQKAYTEAFRPGYQEFGPSGQYYQPIYQSSYNRAISPPGFYSPGYDMPAFYNPFAPPPTEATTEATAESSGEGKASGGAIQSQGIDALLK
jgi:hypothetical protein